MSPRLTSLNFIKMPAIPNDSPFLWVLFCNKCFFILCAMLSFHWIYQVRRLIQRIEDKRKKKWVELSPKADHVVALPWRAANAIDVSGIEQHCRTIVIFGMQIMNVEGGAGCPKHNKIPKPLTGLFCICRCLCVFVYVGAFLLGVWNSYLDCNCITGFITTLESVMFRKLHKLPFLLLQAFSKFGVVF